MAVPVQIHPLVKSSQGPRDAYGRAMNYLRISLTDRCNFRVCLLHAGGRDEVPATRGAPDG